ncbi:MAG: GtrA family protein [Bacteroidia bacterium]|nr:GtrA family protein [Bacteroidia bacterium]
MFLKFIKFGVVGFSGMLVDFGITYLLKEKIKIQKYVANAAGFITAASTNYYLNRIWTYHSTNPKIVNEYSIFIIISVIGLGINSLVLWALVSKYKKHFYLSKLVAIVVTTLWNFIANTLFTFS